MILVRDRIWERPAARNEVRFIGAEHAATRTQLLYNIEYVTDHYSRADINNLITKIATALSMLLSTLSYHEIKGVIRKGEEVTTMASFKTGLIGRPMKTPPEV